MANYPKQTVPPFNKDDIIDIVNDGIVNGDVYIPTPEIEGGTKLYKHVLENEYHQSVMLVSDIPTSLVTTHIPHDCIIFMGRNSADSSGATIEGFSTTYDGVGNIIDKCYRIFINISSQNTMTSFTPTIDTVTEL